MLEAVVMALCMACSSFISDISMRFPSWLWLVEELIFRSAVGLWVR